MFRNGMFIDLIWDKIEEKHKKRWEILKNRYKVVAQTDSTWQKERTEPIEHDGNRKNILDQIADSCIDQCRKYLFCRCIDKLQEEKEDYRNTINAEDDYLNSSMYNNFRIDLCDHLIVTFTYRFYFENLKIKGTLEEINKECRRRILQCQISPSDISDFYTARLKAWNGFCEDISQLIEWYESRRIDKPGNEFGLPAMEAPWEKINIQDQLMRAPNWLFSWVMSTQRGMQMYKLSKNKEQLLIESPKNEKKEEGLSGRLRKFLSGTGYAPLLMTTHRLPELQRVAKDSHNVFHVSLNSDIPMTSRNEYFVNGAGVMRSTLYEGEYTSARAELLYCRQPFVGVAWEHDFLITQRMPAQTYERVDGQGTVTIPIEVQDVLNSYLLERYFHGYAIAVLQDCLLCNDSSWKQYIGLAQATRLQAPLLHARMISFGYQMLKSSSSGGYEAGWMNDYINNWNKTALPILEELFIWSVYKVFQKNQKALMESIEESFLSGNGYERRCERLRLYRLVPCNKIDETVKGSKGTKKDSIEGQYYEYKRQEKEMLNRCVQDAYYNAIGCIFEDKKAIYIDKGIAFTEEGMD